VIILQYTFYDIEAQVFTSDPALGLTQLYERHKKGFARVLGVEVTGAGTDYMNGFYKRQENDEGPREYSRERWARETDGRPWYEKDGGSYIYYSCHSKLWKLNDYSVHYMLNSKAVLPPAHGWRIWFGRGKDPMPTLTVVS